jgi:hypothetical protein
MTVPNDTVTQYRPWATGGAEDAPRGVRPGLGRWRGRRLQPRALTQIYRASARRSYKLCCYTKFSSHEFMMTS